MVLTDATGGAVLCWHGSEDFIAVAHDDEMLIKHGNATAVSEYAALLRKKFIEAGFPEYASDIEVIEVPVCEMTDDVIDEINACLSTSGRVLRLQERLGMMAQARLTP